MKYLPQGLFAQFISFAGIGVVGTSAHYTVLVSLVQIAGIMSVIASAIGFVVGASVNYYLNYRITFRSNKRHSEAVVKFFVVALFGLLLNTLIMALATELYNLYYLLSQVLATGLVLIWNFVCNRLWTFREERNASRTEYSDPY